MIRIPLSLLKNIIQRRVVMVLEWKQRLVAGSTMYPTFDDYSYNKKISEQMWGTICYRHRCQSSQVSFSFCFAFCFVCICMCVLCVYNIG